MRSSGRTTVSRTSERIASVRRSRRGRRVSETAVVVTSLVGFEVFVVIFIISPEVCSRAVERAEPPSAEAIRTVRTEFSRADRALLQPYGCVGGTADDAAPLRNRGHSTTFLLPRLVSV